MCIRDRVYWDRIKIAFDHFESPITHVYIIVYFIVDHFAYTRLVLRKSDLCRTRILYSSSKRILQSWNLREENSQPIIVVRSAGRGRCSVLYFEENLFTCESPRAIPFRRKVTNFLLYQEKIGWTRDKRKQWLYEIPPKSFWMISWGTRTVGFFFLFYSSESNSIRWNFTLWSAV